MLAMTGVITSTTEKNTLITLLQDMEYIHGQLFERSVESGCGSVTCLPGALTILRFSAFRKMAKYYFADKAEQCDDLFDYGKCHLGEDRWLTHLFMIGAKERYQIQMCTGAFCKTEAVQTYRSLLKQRRRWFLGFITNEVCMLTDIRLWKRYPVLCAVRFMQNTIRTTALLFFIMVLSIITTSNKVKNLPVGFIAVSLGLNWLLMFYFGLQLRRFKAWLYPIMFVINPFFNWVYMVYGIFTAGQRTWGGPRADAGSADTNTTVQAAIEHAEATGDDLNVVPETFKPAAQAKRRKGKGSSGGMSLQPSDNLDGRFAPAEKLPGGWYNQDNESNHTLPDKLERNPNTPHVPLHPRSSFDSLGTDTSNGNSIYLPRRVESIMGDEDRRKYMVAQSNQREAGGAYMTENLGPLAMDESTYRKPGWNESAESLGSENSNPGPQRHHHSRASSSHSTAAPGPRTASKSPTRRERRSSNTAPKPAEQAHIAGPRLSLAANTSQAGRSPLARLSFVRTPGNDETATEMTQQQQQQQELPHSQSEPIFPHRRESSGDGTPRGRSPDGRRRNRLTKTHRPGRSG
jgi:chitin synthase